MPARFELRWSEGALFDDPQGAARRAYVVARFWDAKKKTYREFQVTEAHSSYRDLDRELGDLKRDLHEVTGQARLFFAGKGLG